MKTKLPEDIVHNARVLRKNQTDAEKLFWLLLRNRRMIGFKFRRQYPVGRYIVDFYCHAARLGVEFDGGQHNKKKESSYNKERAAFLEDMGIQILRFWNNDVMKNTDVVMEEIYNELMKRTSLTPAPLPKGEG